MADYGIVPDWKWEEEKAKKLVCDFIGVRNLPRYEIAQIIADELEVRKRIKSRHLYNNFGITLEEYNKMLESQNGVCAICGKSETATLYRTGEVIRLAVDHNHKTGKVRGLLCAKCNTTLGNMNDDIEMLQKAIDYIILSDTCRPTHSLKIRGMLLQLEASRY